MYTRDDNCKRIIHRAGDESDVLSMDALKINDGNFAIRYLFYDIVTIRLLI